MNAVPKAPSRSVTVPYTFLEPRSAAPSAPGEVLDDRYVVGNELGDGGGGVVFQAWDRHTSTSVALKFLLPALASKPVWVRRLEGEMSLAQRIRHPNVCSILDFQQWRGRTFIVMDLAVGSLFDERKAALSAGPAPLIDWGRRKRDVLDACRGLAAIHDAGIVHRDIKPENILRMADGRLVVADFGMAVSAGETVTFGGGTPNYMPPEVNLGEPHDLRGDVWQLGTVLHEILLGQRPRWRLDGARPWTLRPVTGVSQDLARWVRVTRRCLSWNPAVRPDNAAAVARLLE